MRGAGRRCPARSSQRCRGRGEAAGDCVFTVEIFRTAAIDRTDVRALAAPGRIVLPSPGFEAPVRIVGKYGKEVERRPRNSHKEGLVTDCGYMKTGGASEHRGGRRVRRQLS